MKAIAFTLDAIFALIIASAAISILLYFQFSPTATYTLKAADAQNLLNILLSTNVTALSGSSTIAYAMVNQQSGANAGWDDLRGGSSSQGSSAYGPLHPFLSYTYTASSPITSGVVADYGDVYFASGNTLYAITKQGALSWKNTSSATIESTPVLLDGQVIYWTTGNIIDLNAYNGSLVWRTGALSSTTPAYAPLGYNDELIFTGANGNLYILDEDNGTVASTNALVGGAATSLAIASGSIAEVSSTKLQLLTNIPTLSTQGMIWSNTLTGTPSGIASEGKIIAVAAGDNAYIYRLNGTVLGSTNTISQVSGIAASGNYTVFQSSSSVTALSNSGSLLWTHSISSLYGTALTGTTPVIAQGNIYSLWSGGYLLSENISTGSISWFTKIPYSNLGANMTLAYGRLYVTAGNKLLAYGACNQNPQVPVLQAALSLYLNGQGSCADYLLNSAAMPLSNYTLVIGNNALFTGSIASFSGSNSYIISGSNYSQLYALTLSFWAYPIGKTGAQQNMIDTTPRTLMVGITSSGNILFDPGNSMTVNTTNAIPYNSWSLITLTALTSGSNTIYNLFINGTKVNSNSISENIAGFNNLAFSSYQSGLGYNGMLANVQLYDTVLNAQQIGFLYQEGLQGGPVSNAGDLSWYPLDGDTNDYGNQTNVAYSVNSVYVGANYVQRALINSFEVGKASTLVSVQNYSTGMQNLYSPGVITWR